MEANLIQLLITVINHAFYFIKECATPLELCYSGTSAKPPQNHPIKPQTQFRKLYFLPLRVIKWAFESIYCSSVLSK